MSSNKDYTLTNYIVKLTPVRSDLEVSMLQSRHISNDLGENGFAL